MGYRHIILSLVLGGLGTALSGCASTEQYQDQFTVDCAFALPGQGSADGKHGATDCKHGSSLKPFDLEKDVIPGFACPTSAAASGSAPAAATPAYELVSQAITAASVAQPGGAAEQAARQCRNRFQWYLVTLSDRYCEFHKGRVYGNQAGANFALGTLTSLLSGTAAIVTGGEAQRILSGSAAFSNATRAQMNESFYQNLLAGAVLKAIDGSRQNYLTQTIVPAQRQDTSSYTLEQSIRDVQTYHQRCSFYAGVVELTDQAARMGTSADAVRGQIAAIEERLVQRKASLAEAQKDAAQPGGAKRVAALRDAITALEQQLSILEARLVSTSGAAAPAAP